MRRSQHDIILKILDICKSDTSKTRIVISANLNFKTVNSYLDLLIKNDLLQSKREKTILYKTTNKGTDLLYRFKKIQSQLVDS
jgi:predicted transcriptional regulator